MTNSRMFQGYESGLATNMAIPHLLLNAKFPASLAGNSGMKQSHKCGETICEFAMNMANSRMFKSH
jgi:hypothetical protein